MKIALVFTLFAAVAHAGVVVQNGVPGQLLESGSSRVARTEDNLGNYAFGYDEIHTSGGSFRREQASPNGGVTGSYGLRDADGRLRTVNYIADDAGFRAAVTSNEPGVESKNTAGALYNQGEVPPGPVPDETVVLAAPAAPVGRFLAAPAPQQLLAAPAPVAAVASAPLAAQIQAPITYNAGLLQRPLLQQQQFLSAPGQLIGAPGQLLAGPGQLLPQQQYLAAPGQLLAGPGQLIGGPAPLAAAPVATQAINAINHGPLLGAQGISAPVLNAPGINAFGQLTNAAVPTVNSNPLTDGPFARFARPAISTPGALATGPLAAPLNPFQPTPLASPQVAGQFSGQLLSAPVPAGPLAPGLAVSGQQLVQSTGPYYTNNYLSSPSAYPPYYQQQVARQQLFAPQLLQQQRLLAAPAAPLAVAGHPGTAAIAGIAYQTTINHALAPAGAIVAGPAAYAPAPLQQVSAQY